MHGHLDARERTAGRAESLRRTGGTFDNRVGDAIGEAVGVTWGDEFGEIVFFHKGRWVSWAPRRLR